MSTPILATKLYRPPPRPEVVHRPRLLTRLHAGLQRKLTLISAPAGFGKTTLVSAWIAECPHPSAWLTLDDRDNDPPRFLSYLVAGELLIGAVVVLNRQVIAAAHTREKTEGRLLVHADFLALEAADRLRPFPGRRRDAALFVNLEPCLMCFGAAMS